MKTLNIRIEFIEEALGLSASNTELYADFIASKAPTAEKMKEEIEAVGVDGVIEKNTTVFPRDENGDLFFWDYQIKGFFKDACGMLRKASGSKCSKIKAFKKEIDGLLFPQPRKIKINPPLGKTVLEVSDCQRPLRASTPQGERVAIAISETVPEGAYLDLSITILKDDLVDMVKECLDYGQLRGLSQWRNSGKGRFEWRELTEKEAEKL